MKKVGFYKHPNCLDTCIEILAFYYIPENDYASVKVNWWTYSPTHGKIKYDMQIKQRFKKPMEYWKQWKPLNTLSYGGK